MPKQWLDNMPLLYQTKNSFWISVHGRERWSKLQISSEYTGIQDKLWNTAQVTLDRDVDFIADDGNDDSNDNSDGNDDHDENNVSV